MFCGKISVLCKLGVRLYPKYFVLKTLEGKDLKTKNLDLLSRSEDAPPSSEIRMIVQIRRIRQLATPRWSHPADKSL
jgi:hypothetical protein